MGSGNSKSVNPTPWVETSTSETSKPSKSTAPPQKVVENTPNGEDISPAGTYASQSLSSPSSISHLLVPHNGNQSYQGLTIDTINPKVRKMKYAVRGRMVAQAEVYKKQLKEENDLPFDQVTSCNIGNPHALKQQPLTFFRQVLACSVYPDLMNSAVDFPQDVKDRAARILADTNDCGLGAYSTSRGLISIRNSVCEYLSKRDGGLEFDPEHIYLTNGASDGISKFLNLVVSGPNDGVMIPIPQYPLYSATIAALGGTQVSYYLDEANNWALSTEELKRSINEARANGVIVKALCVINPGNPTGANLSQENLIEIIEFAKRENLCVLADEVYQTNIYRDGDKFVSMRKALAESTGASSVPLASFHSTSKGFVGECGMRGGFMELVNLDAQVEAELYKTCTVSLCPNLPGQIMVDAMVNPPKEGEPSYALYRSESEGILESLKRRAKMMVESLNNLEGVTCNPVEGALYAFPQVTVPPGAIIAANEAGMPADEFYTMELLKSTGICAVPGSGFGQTPGTFHFRTTILPKEEHMNHVIESMKKFHDGFMAAHK